VSRLNNNNNKNNSKNKNKNTNKFFEIRLKKEIFKNIYINYFAHEQKINPSIKLV